MKWIGQHIWDFISRFRNDVYLEDVNSGTIASGGNLGLDANNRIIKATTPSGGLTINDALDNRIVTSGGGTILNAEQYLTYSIINGCSSFANIGAPTGTFISNSVTNSNNGVTGWNSGSNTGFGSVVTFLNNQPTAGGQNNWYTGQAISINDDATHVGNINYYGLSIGIDFESTSGGQEVKGITNTITDCDVSGDIYGIYQKIENGGVDLRFVSSAQVSDYFQIATGGNGATTIVTEESGGGKGAHLTFDVDGDIIFKPNTDEQFKAAPVGCYNTTTIKVMPHEFLGNNDGGEAWVYDDTAGKISVSISNASNDLSTVVKIPEGFSVTHINFHVDVTQTNCCAAKSFNYTNGDIGVTTSGATPDSWFFNSGTNYQLVNAGGAYPLACNSTTDLFLGWAPGSTARRLYGVTVTIANT
tara:strand:+ start:107 stop:1354 length:1248 start_codon:yes stop_codon:yes gene_type:complete